MRKLTEFELMHLRQAKIILNNLKWDLAEGSLDENHAIDELVVNTAKVSIDFIMKDYK